MEMAHNTIRPSATFALPLVVIRPKPFFMARAAFLGLAMSLALVGWAQSGQPTPIKQPKAPDMLDSPALPLGTTPEYQKAVLGVEKAMEKGDFVAATAAMRLLPHNRPRIAWDDSNVPTRLRSVLMAERDKAFSEWSAGMSFAPRLVTDGSAVDMKISFQPSLNKSVDAKEPLEVAAFFSTDPKEPRLEFVIGLKHGQPLVSSTETDIANDIRFGIGLYLGIAETPIPGGVMYREEKPSGVIPVSVYERVIGGRILSFHDDLDACITRKQKVASGVASAFIDPLKLEPPHNLDPKVSDPCDSRATTVHFTIQVTNHGTAAMETRLVPGCSCFSTTEPQTIPAGQTRLYPLDMNTVEYVGRVNKTIVLLTSDPDKPCIKLPLSVQIRPRYRFLSPQGDTILVGPDGGEFTLYLAVEGDPFTLEGQPNLVGIPGTVTYEPWSGSLPDPALGEPARPRKGYKLNLDVKPQLTPGHTFVGVDVTTTDSTFRKVSARLWAQRGIIALPDRANLGHIGPVARSFEITLTRPGKPFHIIGLSADDPKHIRVNQHVTKDRPWEHIVKFTFDGQVESGGYSSNIIVRTDDPDQPKITIPIFATVG